MREPNQTFGSAIYLGLNGHSVCDYDQRLEILIIETAGRLSATSQAWRGIFLICMQRKLALQK
jgi:hypothetical protein